mmetsp:Transcript_28718/g.65084  ORF Transcript_28718/g.65084 Transcript_28718/m.65084 type:complete len:200 (-) Transcript_28718:445-1044(-)
MLIILPVLSNASANVRSPISCRSTSCRFSTSMSTPLLSILRSLSLMLPFPAKKSSLISRLIISIPSPKSSASSSDVLTPMMASTIAPAELPDMTRGSRPCKNSALITPKWYMPRLAPPDSSSAVLPRAWRDSVKKSSFSCIESSSSLHSQIPHIILISSSLCLSISLFVPTCVCLYNSSFPVPPRFLVSPDRSQKTMLE